MPAKAEQQKANDETRTRARLADTLADTKMPSLSYEMPDESLSNTRLGIHKLAAYLQGIWLILYYFCFVLLVFFFVLFELFACMPNPLKDNWQMRLAGVLPRPASRRLALSCCALHNNNKNSIYHMRRACYMAKYYAEPPSYAEYPQSPLLPRHCPPLPYSLQPLSCCHNWQKLFFPFLPLLLPLLPLLHLFLLIFLFYIFFCEFCAGCQKNYVTQKMVTAMLTHTYTHTRTYTHTGSTRNEGKIEKFWKMKSVFKQRLLTKFKHFVPQSFDSCDQQIP